MSGTLSQGSNTLAAPPSYDEICSFVAEFAGRLPSHALTGTAPYEYTGCDYALILYALFPTRCVDLSRFCWSTRPLPSQLEANLILFCEVARELQLCDAPISALQPHLLRAEPLCVVHHIRVQHWLYVLSQRFRPEGAFDAVTVRMERRHAQLGEPYLQTQEADAVEASVPFVPPVLHCDAIWRTAPIDVTRKDEVRPPKTQSQYRERPQQSEQQERNEESRYTRPWRAAATKIPPRRPNTAPGSKTSLFSSTTSGAVTSSAALTNRNRLSNSSRSGSLAESASGAPCSLAAQWNESQRRQILLKRSLSEARDSAQRMLFLNGCIEFERIQILLEQKEPQAS